MANALSRRTEVGPAPEPESIPTNCAHLVRALGSAWRTDVVCAYGEKAVETPKATVTDLRGTVDSWDALAQVLVLYSDRTPVSANPRTSYRVDALRPLDRFACRGAAGSSERNLPTGPVSMCGRRQGMRACRRVQPGRKLSRSPECRHGPFIKSPSFRTLRIG